MSEETKIISIELDRPQWDTLKAQAIKDQRSVKGQASMYVLQGMERNMTDTIIGNHTRPIMAHVAQGDSEPS